MVGMVFVALSLDGTRSSAVQLQPDVIYRIGRRLGLEFHSDDKSIELAHATITLIGGEIVRVSTVAGKVYVNGREIEIKSIVGSDIVNTIVDLRFGEGDVNAKLYFDGGRLANVDNEAAHDSSGYEEGHKDKSTITNDDSSIIPESRPPSADTTRDEESINIPETQAVSFTRRSKDQEKSRISCGDDVLIPETQVTSLGRPPIPLDESTISCGDDFLIPETQDVLPHSTNLNQDINSDDDASELGTQIRICTQEFNEFNEDAIDDFDSSLLIGDVNINATVFGGVNYKQTPDVLGDERDMSALNWSASNSKCTALNSTKADEVFPRSEICLTPDLSATESKSNGLEDVPCTPDLFDILHSDANESSGSRAAELVNVNADVHSISSHQHTVGPAEQPLVGSIETPETTPANPEGQLEDNIAARALSGRSSQDIIVTQAFDKVNLQLLCNSHKNYHNEDFIETQAFPARNLFQTSKLNFMSRANQDNDKDDFIETEPYPARSSKNEENQDFVQTQAFPKKKSFLAPQLKFKPNKIYDNSQDFIATQAFISHPQTFKSTANVAGSMGLNNAEDFIKTQLFVSRDKNTSINLNQSDCSRLQLSDSLSIGDELDDELKQLIAISSLPSSQSEDDKLVNSPVIPGKIHEEQVCQPKEIVNDLERKEKCAHRGRKRAGPLSGSPVASPRKIKRTRKLLELPTPVENKTSTKATRIQRKRPSDLTEDKEETKSIAAPKLKEIKQRKVKKTTNSKDNDNTEISAEQLVSHRRTRQDTLKIDADSFINTGQCSSAQKIVNTTVSASHKDSSCTEVPGSSNAQSARKLRGKSAIKSGRAPKAQPKHNSRPSEEESATPIDSEPTPIVQRAMSAQRTKLPSKDPLQDINDYIKKIKSSGRKIQVTMSMCNYTELRSLLNSLRNVIDVTENPLCSDLLLMDKGERTYKFLVTVASNKPVLSTSWLHAIKETRSIVVKPNHIFQDKKFEEVFKYNPLSVMEQPSILKDYHFMLGNTILPNVKEMKAIVESAGGTVHGKLPPLVSNVRLYVIASKQDKQIFQQLTNYSNLQYTKPEGVMQAIVRHKRELMDEYKLQI